CVCVCVCVCPRRTTANGCEMVDMMSGERLGAAERLAASCSKVSHINVKAIVLPRCRSRLQKRMRDADRGWLERVVIEDHDQPPRVPVVKPIEHQTTSRGFTHTTNRMVAGNTGAVRPGANDDN